MITTIALIAFFAAFAEVSAWGVVGIFVAAVIIFVGGLLVGAHNAARVTADVQALKSYAGNLDQRLQKVEAQIIALTGSAPKTPTG